jgi:thiol peroxidase
MATITLKGNPVHTVGELPKLGTKAPGFRLTRVDMSELSLSDLAGKKKLLNIVPSLETGVCAASTRRFNEEAAKVPNAVLLTISRDLPYTQKRFCETEGIKGVITLSAMRDLAFGEAYGVKMVDGPMASLFSRAVVVLDEGDKVVYTEQVPEIAQEPDYPKALAALAG